MAETTYFQRYSSKENTVTNNTLQLFSRIYDYSPGAFADLLNEIAGTADDDRQIEVGPSIIQQSGSGSSVPDANIHQQSFRLLLETKTEASISTDQLRRHTSAFRGETVRVLVLITKSLPNEQELKNLTQVVDKEDSSIIFNVVDFRRLCDQVEALFQPYEREIRVITDDYRSYCREVGVLDRSEEVMRIVPCGDSHELNEKYGIYYHPADRGYTPHAYVGVYVDKRVTSLWRIRSVLDVTLDARGNLDKKRIEGEDTSQYDQSIKSIVREARSRCGHEIAEGHRFFCGEPFSTDFKKTSKYGIQKNRYCNLKEKLEAVNVDLGSPEEVARALRDCEWQ